MKKTVKSCAGIKPLPVPKNVKTKEGKKSSKKK